MKDIKQMEVEELRKEMDELWRYLYMTRETGTYDRFEWKGLDYWDADRRHYKISQEILLRSLTENDNLKNEQQCDIHDCCKPTKKDLMFNRKL